MAITINDKEITPEMIEAEMQHHPQHENPQEAATQTLVLRELMLQRAREIGLVAENDDDLIGSLLSLEVPVENADEAECLAFFEANKQHFRQEELVEARHILFPLEGGEASLIRAKAEGVLDTLKANPERFAELAQEHSACPSGPEGGALGPIARGQTVPLFERALFGLDENELCGQLVETQFGLHIIQAGQKQGGGEVQFDDVKGQLSEYLGEMSMRSALQDYLVDLAKKANIIGYQLPGTDAQQ